MSKTFWENNHQAVLKKLKTAYTEHLDFLQITDHDFSRFIWAGNKCVSFYVFSLENFDTSEKALIIVKPSAENKIIFQDCKTETNNYSFKENQFDTSSIISFLKNNLTNCPDIFTDISESQVMYSQYNEPYQMDLFIQFVLYEWIEKEYSATKQQLETRGLVESYRFSKQKLYIDKYHFDTMLQTINDDQLTDELNQCLIAYDQQLWFICATGLGGNIEHLLYLVIKLSGFEDKLGTDTSIGKYISILRKDLGADIRRCAFIKAVENFRNAVSHYNSGQTNKNICDILLDGIVDIYNDFYLPAANGQKFK